MLYYKFSFSSYFMSYRLASTFKQYLYKKEERNQTFYVLAPLVVIGRTSSVVQKCQAVPLKCSNGSNLFRSTYRVLPQPRFLPELSTEPSPEWRCRLSSSRRPPLAERGRGRGGGWNAWGLHSAKNKLSMSQPEAEEALKLFIWLNRRRMPLRRGCRRPEMTSLTFWSSWTPL